MSEENSPTTSDTQGKAMPEADNSETAGSGSASEAETGTASPGGPAVARAWDAQEPLKVPRLGFGENVTEAVKHVKKSVDAQGSSMRASDKLSAWLVPITSIALMAALLCDGWVRMAISILCLASLLYYILGRIGIMRTLSERQATLVWHILLGTFLLGIVFTFVYLQIIERLH